MKKIGLTTALIFNSIIIVAQCFNVANVYSFNYNGHTYKIVKENKTWENASSCAVMDGGYLAEFNDLAEHNAIFAELTVNANITNSNTTNEFGTAAVWIGGSDSQSEGTWIWDGNNDDIGTQFWSGGVGGTVVGGAYSNWGTNPPEPDNSGNQDKLTLTIANSHPNFGKWNDLASDIFNEIYFIIEYDVLLSLSEEKGLKSNLKVYPNPFTNNIYVSINSLLKITDIKISNNMGQIVYSEKPKLDNNIIKLPDLEAGVYYLNIFFEKGDNTTYKIVAKD